MLANGNIQYALVNSNPLQKLIISDSSLSITTDSTETFSELFETQRARLFESCSENSIGVLEQGWLQLSKLESESVEFEIDSIVVVFGESLDLEAESSDLEAKIQMIKFNFNKLKNFKKIKNYLQLKNDKIGLILPTLGILFNLFNFFFLFLFWQAVICWELLKSLHSKLIEQIGHVGKLIANFYSNSNWIISVKHSN